MSAGVAHVYVGTDARMAKAERALAYGLRRHASGPVQVHWMRAGDPGFDDWNLGRERGRPYSGRGWATDFSCFRFAVPALAGCRGRALYLDADILVLGDVHELLGRTLTRPWTCPGGGTEVSVIDCAAFRDLDGWPSLAAMKASGAGAGVYVHLLRERGLIDPTLPAAWNVRDRWRPDAKLIHFTSMYSQPWRPWPDVLTYRPHPDPRAEALFWEHYHGAAP